MFKFRNGTMDAYIFYQVVHSNEYQLKNDLSKYNVLDIGAHIGSFSVACFNRNAQQIKAYELHPENFIICQENLKGKADVFNVGVLGCQFGSENETVGYSDLTSNTGQHRVNFDEKEKIVSTVIFDNILEDILNGYENIIKLDCEGSEYDIIYSSKKLDRVNNIVGEYHNNIDTPESSIFDYNGKTLMAFLQSEGFYVWSNYIQDAGLFIAVKDLDNNPFILRKEYYNGAN